jgi:hypothetical protein
MTAPPADREFLLPDERTTPARLAALADRLLDARLALARSGARLDELAATVPARDVLVLSIQRPGGAELARALDELRGTRHSLRVALGSMGASDPSLAGDTVATNLDGGKFGNLNAVIDAAGGEADWVLVVDDDVRLPSRFLDRLLGVCERLHLALAQPAQSRASFAGWPHTRRRAGSMARETRFVEIGPVTCFRRDAFQELTPFPPLRYGWGLDLHWGAVAAERGWRLGIVDALPVRHEHSGVAAAYSSRDAIEEARGFLAGRPFVASSRASEVVRAHPLR